MPIIEAMLVAISRIATATGVARRSIHETNFASAER